MEVDVAGATGSLGGQAAGSTPSLPHTELLQIHNCLRTEVGELFHRVEALGRSAGSLEQWPLALGSLLQQFDFFFVVYNSHSKAEDDVIIPALVRKGLAKEAEAELRKDHSGHGEAFEKVRLLLLHLRGQTAAGLDGRRSTELASLLQHLADLVERIKSSVLLHLRKEEEELFPLLELRFEEGELAALAGHILGNRSSELVNSYMQMIIRDLSPVDKARAIESIKQAAHGTRFSRWMERSDVVNRKSLIATGEFVHVPAASVPGAEPSWHVCQSPGECCVAAVAGAERQQQQQQQQQEQQQEQQEQRVLGCKHYRRGCKLMMPCCKELHCCRQCHDESVTERSILSPGRTAWHQANRYDVTEMWCMQCGALQPVSQTCACCHASMAKYACDLCNFFDDAKHRDIYHCPYCNVCRVGKGLGDDFEHCMKCNACISKQVKSHKCLEHSLEGDCAICQQNLFDTTTPLKHLLCGHFMHRDCYHKYVQTNVRCPICRKSVCDMQLVWAKYAAVWKEVVVNRTDGQQPCQVQIHCNDCQQDAAVTRLSNLPAALQTLPNQCPYCTSFNTE